MAASNNQISNKVLQLTSKTLEKGNFHKINDLVFNRSVILFEGYDNRLYTMDGLS